MNKSKLHIACDVKDKKTILTNSFNKRFVQEKHNTGLEIHCTTIGDIHPNNLIY